VVLRALRAAVGHRGEHGVGALLAGVLAAEAGGHAHGGGALPQGPQLDLRVHQILEGTNEIMRVIVARSLLEGRE
jgi:alkylation response protein AidB-like acyl-CoA dehydrogenase